MAKAEKRVAALEEAKRQAFIENRPYVKGIANNNGWSNELDVTKDNLRLFVERWREHPDSPYTIDTYHTLSKNLTYERDESVSLRAHSPSPCDSLPSSSTQSERMVESVRDNTGGLLSVPTLSLSLERRASEGMTVHNRRDPASQIALAEEIIKLSEHLRSIAIGESRANIKKNDENVTKADRFAKNKLGDNIGNSTYPTSNVKVSVSRDDKEEINEITEKLSNITRQRKLNGTTFHSNRNFNKYACDADSRNVFVALRETNIGDGETSERYKNRKYCFEQSTTISDTIEQRFNKKTINKKTPQASSVSKEEDKDLMQPWRRSRVKRSFDETSRDVPRISNLQNVHKNLNLDEPGSAKDLLLHLLGEWDEIPATSYSGAGRKSVSLDWCAGESVARRTMNSLAEYFQSKQQEAQSSDVTSSASPSMYR